MDLGNILKKVGGAIISTVVPGGSAIIGLINGFLPEDKKLPDNATGAQAQSAIATLSSVDQAQILKESSLPSRCKPAYFCRNT